MAAETRVCAAILIMIYSFVVLALSIVSYVKINSNQKSMEDVTDNWNQGAIIDITVDTFCPSGYSTAYSGRSFAGTEAGCWCGDVSFVMKVANNVTCFPFCDRPCDVAEAYAGCNRVDRKGSVPFIYWGSRNGQNSQNAQGSNINTQNNRLCVKTSSETWLDIAPVSVGGTCPEKYLKCGNTTDNVFCTRQTKCPITKFTVSSVPGANSTTCNPQNNCLILSTDVYDTKIIQYERSDTFDGRPLAQLDINEYSMCKDKATSNITPGRKVFELYLGPSKTCSSEGASQWTTIDTITEEQLFSLNGISNTINYLNAFTDSGMSGYYPSGKSGADYNYGLFTRAYIPWASRCRDRMREFVRRLDETDSLKRGQLGLLIVACIATVVVGLIISIMEISNGGESDELDNLRIGGTLFFMTLTVGFELWAIVVCSKQKVFFAKLANDQCSNGFVNQEISDFNDALTASYVCNIVSLALTALFISGQLCNCSVKLYKEHVGDCDCLSGGKYKTKSKNTELPQSSPANGVDRNWKGYLEDQPPQEFQGALDDMPPPDEDHINKPYISKGRP